MDDFQTLLNQATRALIAPQTAAVMLAVIGLNIHFGYTGLLNIGQSAFMLLGAYGFAITISQGYPMILGIILGLVLALVFALILGIPTLKLRGDYLAIVTISAAEIIRYIGRSVAFPKLTELTGGAQGLPSSKFSTPFTNLSFLGDGSTQLTSFNYSDVAGGATWFRLLALLVVLLLGAATVQMARGRAGLVGTPRIVAALVLGVVTFLGLFFVAPVNQQNTGASGWWFTVVTWIVVLVSTVIVLGLTRSPWGRLLRGIREDEDAMRSLGKNVFAVKMQALIIGGLFGAVGGMLFVLPSTVQPDALARNLTFQMYTALLLGGAATIWGPVLGSMIFFVGRLVIQTAAGTYLTSGKYIDVMSIQQAQQFSFILVGVALMLLVIFRPQGILGNKRELRFDV